MFYKEIRGYNEEEQIEAIEEVAARGANVLALTPINTERVISKLNSLTMPIVTFNNDLRLDKNSPTSAAIMWRAAICAATLPR